VINIGSSKFPSKLFIQEELNVFTEALRLSLESARHRYRLLSDCLSQCKTMGSSLARPALKVYNFLDAEKCKSVQLY